MNLALLGQVFWAFAKANMLGYGGGPSVVPLIEAEVVKAHAWMTADDFASALAVGNSLPGPIATKMSAFIGYKVAGTPGALSALLGTVVPSALLMVALAAVLMKYRDVPFIQGMIKAVKAVVFVMFALLAVDFFRFAWPLSAGWIPAIIAVASFVAMYFFQVHQALAVLAALVVGALFLR